MKSNPITTKCNKKGTIVRGEGRNLVREVSEGAKNGEVGHGKVEINAEDRSQPARESSNEGSVIRKYVYPQDSNKTD
jgi:hypothetical protein